MTFSVSANSASSSNQAQIKGDWGYKVRFDSNMNVIEKENIASQFYHHLGPAEAPLACFHDHSVIKNDVFMGVARKEFEQFEMEFEQNNEEQKQVTELGMEYELNEGLNWNDVILDKAPTRKTARPGVRKMPTKKVTKVRRTPKPRSRRASEEKHEQLEQENENFTMEKLMAILHQNFHLPGAPEQENGRDQQYQL